MSPTSLDELLFQQTRRAEERADRIFEAVIGIVVDNKDPDKLARVKVRFPCFGGQDSSAWASLAALGAGADRGWFFLPELDDEVLVMFAHGDIRRPIIIGALWNGQDAPCDKNDGGNERRTIVSRAGSRIVFDDAEGTVSLEDGGGHGTITLSAANRITLASATGDVCIQAAAGPLEIVAAEVAIEAQQNCHLESLGGINLGSDADLTIKAGLLQVHAQTLDLNPGGVGDPAEATAACAAVPDPLGG